MSKRQCTTGGGFRFSGGVGPHFRLEIVGNPIDPIGKGVADISKSSQIAGCNGWENRNATQIAGDVPQFVARHFLG
jgi:hypothetical protein